MSDFPCPKCGAVMKIKPGVQIAACSYCDTVTYIDRSNALFFYILPFSIDETKAKGIFKRWTAGPEMAKELESSAKILSFKKEYFPVFRFRRTVNGKEQIFVKPAKGTVLPGMQNLTIPPGNLVAYDAKFNAGDAKILEADISIDSYLSEMPGTSIDQALVYFPIYQISFEFIEESYEIVIDGSSGAVYSTRIPERSSASYMAVMGLAFVLALIGGILTVIASPVFLILIVAGFFAGKILGTHVARKPEMAK